jgi:Ca2+/Na+ antiporter
MIYLILSSFNNNNDVNNSEPVPDSNNDDGITLNESSILSDDSYIRQQRVVLVANKELSILSIMVKGFLKIMSTPWDILLKLILPKSKDGWFIWLHVVIPLFLIWNVSEIELFLLEKLISRLKSSPAFLGLTIMSWGNNTPDMFNVASAMSKGMISLALDSAIASEIHNILLGLGLPWLVYNCVNNKGISMAKSDIYTTTISFFCVFILSFILLLKINKGKLNARFSVFLITAYIVFFTLIFILYYKK